MGGDGPEIEKALMSGMRDAVEAGYRQGKRAIREITKTVSLSDDWDDVLPEEALSWLDRYVPELARVYENAVLEDVRDVISRSLREGMTNSLTATELGRVNRQLSRFARSRLECIARTEAMRAYSMGSLRSAIDSEAVVGFEFSAVLDSRTSEICHAREGMRFRINDPRLAHNTPPLHPNCRSVLLPLTAEEFPDGIEEDTRIDGLPDSTQRPIDIEAVRAVLSGVDLKGLGVLDEVIEAFKEAKTIKEANEWAKAHIADDADYAGVNLEIINEWNRGIYETQQMFPELRQNFDMVGTCQAAYKKPFEAKLERARKRLLADAPDMTDEEVERLVKMMYPKREVPEVDRNVLAFSLSGGYSEHHKTRGVFVNKAWGRGGKLKKSNAYDVSVRWHPEGCDTVKATVDHELGHQIDALVGGREDPEIVAYFRGICSEDPLSTKQTEMLSGYGGYSPNVQTEWKAIGEFIAESWSEYRNNPHPREVATTVSERLIELYKTKKRKGDLKI